MKILVTGSKGMLGTDLLELLIIDGHETKGVDRDEIDICDLGGVLKAAGEYRPDIIINCAAYTNVDGCETNLDAAYKGNAIGPKNLAIASNQFDIPLLHISTDYIFDGEKSKPYLEDDFPNPQSVYGKSKLAAESNIKTLTNKYFIIRTQWLFGKNGKNFVKTMLSLAKENGRLTVVNDQFGSPTYTRDLASAICEIIKTKSYGTYHVTNSGFCSWYEFTKSIMEFSKTDVEIIPCSTSEFKRPANRPPFSVLDNYYMRLCGFKELRNYKEALADYLKENQ